MRTLFRLPAVPSDCLLFLVLAPCRLPSTTSQIPCEFSISAILCMAIVYRYCILKYFNFCATLYLYSVPLQRQIYLNSFKAFDKLLITFLLNLVMQSIIDDN